MSKNYDGIHSLMGNISFDDIKEKDIDDAILNTRIFDIKYSNKKTRKKAIESMSQDNIDSFCLPFKSIFLDYGNKSVLVFQNNKDQVGTTEYTHCIVFAGINNGKHCEYYDKDFLLNFISFKNIKLIDDKYEFESTIGYAAQIDGKFLTKDMNKGEAVGCMLLNDVIAPMIDICNTKNFVMQIREGSKTKKTHLKSPSMNMLRYIFGTPKVLRKIAGIESPKKGTGKKVLERRAHWRKAHWHYFNSDVFVNKQGTREWREKQFIGAIFNGQEENTKGRIHYKILAEKDEE